MLKRTGFKRPAYQPAPRQRLMPLRRGFDGVAKPLASFPKHDYVRSAKLMKAYRAIACQHCGADDGTVCGAHANWGWGRGRGVKADDNRCASLCHRCHGALDQGATWSEAQRKAMWWTAHVRTVQALQRLRLWPAEVPVPDTSANPFQEASEATP